MSNLTPTTAKGQTLFEAGAPTRIHSDLGDNKVASTYSHNVLEWSGTEADEWASQMLFMSLLAQSGGHSSPIRNATGGTLVKGTLVRLSGYASSKITVVKADADDAHGAQLVLASDLANNTNGFAYGFIPVTGTVSQPLDTSGASAVGDPVYLSGTAGEFTFTAPTGVSQLVQMVGIVLVKDATVGSIAFFPAGRMVDLTSVSGDLMAYKSADETKNNDTTFADDSELTVALPQAGVYAVEVYVKIVTSNTPGIKWGLNGPAKNDVLLLIDQRYNFCGDLTDYTSGASATWNPAGSPDTGYATIQGTVDVSAAGDLAFSWAQAVSDAADCTIKKGSWMRVKRIS